MGYGDISTDYAGGTADLITLVESTITRRYGVSTTPVRGWVRHSMRGLIDGPTPLTQVVPYHGGGTD